MNHNHFYTEGHVLLLVPVVYVQICVLLLICMAEEIGERLITFHGREPFKSANTAFSQSEGRQLSHLSWLLVSGPIR